MRFETSTCDNSGSLDNTELVDLGTDLTLGLREIPLKCNSSLSSAVDLGFFCALYLVA